MLGIIQIFLHLLRLVLCPNIWYVLENVPYALERSVYYIAWGRKFLKISVISIWFHVSCGQYFLTDSLNDLSIAVSEVEKFPTTIVYSPVSPFRSASTCFIYFGTPKLSANTVFGKNRFIVAGTQKKQGLFLCCYLLCIIMQYNL